MATPRRTSARIRAKTPSKTSEPTTTLGSLIERDETPDNQQSIAETISPQRNGQIPGAFENDSFLFTPSARPEADHDKMHPSKVQHSTTKTADESLLLGFSSIKNRERSGVIEDTPSKSKLAAPGFEFKFAHANKDLAAETQRIMESVREEAARIKEQMRRDKLEQADQDVDMTGRKIAQPKGKSSRYSDAHKAQFSKMDSIANHPSVWKGVSVQVSPAKTLKRSQSAAELVDERPENPSPTKRAKSNGEDDVSAARPVSRDGSNIPRPPTLPAVATTPTKASLARSASIKSARNTKIPGLLHSKSAKELVRPKEAVEEATTRSLFGLKKSISVKSILSRPQPKYSNDPIKIAAGTHLPLQEQPSGTPVKAIKRVGFAEDLTSPTPTRPSGIKMPTKVLTPYKKAETTSSSESTSNVSTPSKSPSGSGKVVLKLAQTTPVKSSSLRATQSTPSEIKSDPVVITSPTPRKIIEPVSCSKISTSNITYPTLNSLGSNPSRPGDFTFRADRQIRFGPSQTIRPVRPSGIPTTIASFAGFPTIPHGMPGKKRARPEDDDEVPNQENSRPIFEGSPSKKLRVSIGQDIKPVTPRKLISKQKSLTPGSGKKTLSLSRLNFLARPKNRG